ncbi:MAG: BamA/TamA family outer membrane protein [Phycisphaerales bacterium]|nr:BamA/TamA family outer membrane protein [Phycisphaerales bacterium]
MIDRRRPTSPCPSHRLLAASVGAALLIATAAGAAGQPIGEPIEPPADEQPVEDPRPPQGPTAVPPAELEVYEGRLIREIVIQRPVSAEKPNEFVPLDAADRQDVENTLRSKTGGQYLQRTIVGDIERLNRRGRYRQVDLRVALQDDGSVILIVTVVLQPIVKDVQSVGNKELSDQDIEKEVEILVGTPVDRYQLDRACRRIKDRYKEKGYYLAECTVDEKELEEQGIVLFKVREGERIKVTDIRFEGNNSFTPRELSSQIKTKEAWPIFRRGPLDDDLLDTDVAALTDFYRDRGYLDVRVDRIVRPAPNGREAIVTFVIDEGRVYTLRTVQVLFPGLAQTFDTIEEARAAAKPLDNVLQLGPGNFAVYPNGVFSTQQIRGMMLIKPGDVYSQDRMRKSFTAIRDAYAKLGYVFDDPDRGSVSVDLQTRELRDPDQPQVDVLLRITEGKPYKVGLSEVAGDEITKQSVIRHQLDFQPERPVDMTAIEESKKRLERLRLFRPGSVKITIQAPDPEDPEYRDVLTEVEETNTGAFTFGVSVGSDDGLGGSVMLEQRNFDVADWPDSFSEFTSGRAFRGAGQTFRAEARPGTEVQVYSVTLTEPHLFDSDYSGSGSIFFRKRDYDEYDEERYGTRFSTGRKFGTRWTGSLPIRIESINLSDIDEGEPVDYWEVADQNILTSVGVSFVRNSLDDFYRPSKGSRIELGFEQVGALGGDFTFNAFRAQHQIFLTVSEGFLGDKTVLSFKTSMGYIPQGPDEAPVYERFYLGGQSFRGFNYRTISPKGIRYDTGTLGDDPVGGTWSFFFGPEILQPILTENVALAGFIDSGTVVDDVGFDKYRVSVGFGVRLFIPQLSPAPLAFDFGFPLVKYYGDRERVFTFSIDIPF